MRSQFLSWVARLASAGGVVAAAAGAGSAEVKLVANAGLVAVIEPERVRVYTGDGRLLVGLPPTAKADSPIDPATPSEIEQRRERVFEMHDIPPELRDSQQADDLLEQELPLSHRRRPTRPGAAGEPEQTRPLAAGDSAGRMWVAVNGGLYRIDPTGLVARLGSLPAPAQVLALDDAGGILLATRSRLLASADGTAAFREVVSLDRQPTHLVLDPHRRWAAWADATGVHVLRGGVARPLGFGASFRDLQSCGGHLVVLADDGVHVGLDGAAPAPVQGPLPAAQLACPRAGPGPWLAFGEGLSGSLDQGRTFHPRADAPAGAIQAAAVTGDRIWVASARTGITTLPWEASGTASPAAPPTTALDEEIVSGRPAPGWAAFLLPRLTVAASYARSSRRRDFRALALAELPLGRDSPSWRLERQRPPRLLALADPSAPAQVPPQQPASAYPQAYAGLPAAPYPAYPPRDPDAACVAQARARAVSQAQAEPERARSLVARAGRAAWLPELRLLAEGRMGRSESLDVRPSGATGPRDAFGLDATNNVRYEVRATWDLPRLVFSPEEVAAVHEALRMADMRREIEAQVNRVYFERRRLLVSPVGSPPPEATGALLRVEELEAELDALSAGEFSRCRGAGPPRLGL